MISILGEAVNPELVSAGSLITRPLSSGKQTFVENTEMSPVGKPIPKVESLPQVSGEPKDMSLLSTKKAVIYQFMFIFVCKSVIIASKNNSNIEIQFSGKNKVTTWRKQMKYLTHNDM